MKILNCFLQHKHNQFQFKKMKKEFYKIEISISRKQIDLCETGQNFQDVRILHPNTPQKINSRQ